jgi:hypothetical protein
MNLRDLEYEDAYVLEEKNIHHNIDDYILTSRENDDLTLGSLNLSEDGLEDTVNDLAADYAKLKAATELTKRKTDVNTKAEFRAKAVSREEVVEDYIKNFFTKYKLLKTLSEFNVSYTLIF